MAFLLVTAVLALFSSLAFGANFTRDYKILRDSATYYTNLAIYGTPTQSSTYSDSCNPTASKATDGNNEGVFKPWCSVTLTTNSDASAWWEVDLNANSIVYSVVVFNRIDCCMTRLTNFDVILKDQSHKVLRSIHEVLGGTEIIAFSMYPILTGVRYVRVQLREKNYLSLAEVEVYGSNKLATKRNLAQNQPASQSSTYNHSCFPTASLAVDGNTEGIFYPWCSVALTNKDQQAWWQVDLQDSHTVDLVHVFNRVDKLIERLANFNVTLKDANGKTLATQNFVGGAQTQIYTFDQIVNNVRYVRVHLIGNSYLGIAEVQVIGE
ncbi:fucolectin-5-like [Oscarella lobularis]|uniref:fucolectin-5-like n=1 Tax=Oscarella lobularis TaxID=121494 RepID=UPI003313D2A5